MSASRVFENLTRNQYVGVGLAGVVVVVAVYFLVKKAASDTAKGLDTLATKLAKATGLKSASDSISQASAAIADSSPDANGATFSSWYDPTQRTVWFYWLTFPDGSSHFIGAGSVNSDGTFDYNGDPYRIGNSKAGDLRAYAYDTLPVDFGVTGGGW
jgi:glutamine cyclotransferase